MVSKLKNEYFLELVGYCLEDGNRMLAYQFATMGSLHNILHGAPTLLISNLLSVRNSKM